MEFRLHTVSTLNPSLASKFSSYVLVVDEVQIHAFLTHIRSVCLLGTGEVPGGDRFDQSKDAGGLHSWAVSQHQAQSYTMEHWCFTTLGINANRCWACHLGINTSCIVAFVLWIGMHTNRYEEAWAEARTRLDCRNTFFGACSLHDGD